MGQIEELPDDFHEALDLHSPPAAKKPARSGQGTGLRDIAKDGGKPASAASEKPKTADEILKMMSETPLFMTNLDDAADAEENPGLEALRALQYEGTRGEIALGFKEQGNEMVKAKMWADAKEFYNKGIAVLTSTKKWEEGADAEEGRQKEKALEEACYVNRALCNLELKNYRSTTLDCAAALRVNPDNVKAYYRSTLALLALDKLEEAEDACMRGLDLDRTNMAIKQLFNKILDRRGVLEERARVKQEEETRISKQKLLLATAIRARGIRTRTTNKPPELEDATIHLAPDPLSPESSLVFPAVLLYPMHAQSDFIKAFSEVESIGDHVKYIFPLPWDTEQEYKVNTVDCYMETTTGGLIKAGKKLPLLKLLTSGKTEVIDGFVKINVVPSAKAAGWIEEMKTRAKR